MVKNDYTVRIERVALRNFKNIQNGAVFYSEYKRLERKDADDANYSNILGIYGQNASGKTSIIDALSIIRHFISGGGTTIGLRNYIKKGFDSFGISVSFLLTNSEKTMLVDYSIDIKSSETTLYVDSETMQCSEADNCIKKLGERKTVYSYSKTGKIKDSVLSLVEGKEQKTILNYLASQKTSTSAATPAVFLCSSLFNNESLKIIENEKKMSILSSIVDSLSFFAKNKFFIVTTNLFDGINTQGIGINGFAFNENQERTHRNFAILFGRQTLEINEYESFLKVLDASGKVLNTLIPGLSIKPHIYNETFNASGQKAIEFEVMSVRDGKEIPFYFESRGVKQMLTYVGDLIAVFNEDGTFIAIDELDSGVFEYLLGELIYSFDNFALGQLLFTSHNFRILEKIRPHEIFFTTANDANKFVQPKYIKSNNNLRDVYYRLIVQGDDKEVYYSKTSATEISKTLSSLAGGKK